MTTVIDRIYSEHQELVALLQAAGELSMVSNVDESFRKSLALAAASYFEVRLRECILEYAEYRANGDELLLAFLRNKAIERQYHTYFDWKQRKANQFFGLFGAAFKASMIARASSDRAYGESIAAFLELGELRNNLAHQDYAAFPMDKTVAEIFDLYRSALQFVDDLPTCLRAHAASSENG